MLLIPSLLASPLVTSLALARAPTEKQRVKADDLANTAWEAERTGDYQGAAKQAGKALKLDPDSVLAHYVLGETLLAATNGDDSEEARWLQAAAMREMETVVALSPDSFMGAVAANYLRPPVDLSVLDPAPVVCSPAADAEFGKAEAAWAHHDYLGAQAAYATAIQACPDNAALWLNSGDAWYGLEDYTGAIARYDKALELYPCYAPALRFRADAEIAAGDLPTGLVDATRAVACNPAYDIGWTYLAGLWSPLRRELRWEHPRADADPKAWAAFSRVRGAKAAAEGDASVISRYRSAALAGIDVWRALPPGERDTHPMWGELAEAADAGVLEPALFIWLLDGELAPVFARWRVEHLGETVAYIKDHLVEREP